MNPEIDQEKFADRVRKVADIVGGQAELSRRTGISTVSIGNYVAARSDPSRGNVISMAGAAGVLVGWLATGEGPMHLGEPAPCQKDDFDYIPMAEAKLSAGGGAFVISEAMLEYYAFRRDWLRKTVTEIKNTVLMGVTGNSMEPTIYDGDIVMLDTGRTHIYDGNIYALRMDDTIMVKRLSLRPGDQIQVISDNKNEYDPYESNRKDIHVLAQVVWFARALVRPE